MVADHKHEDLGAHIEEAIPSDRTAVVDLFCEDLEDLGMTVDRPALTTVFDSMIVDPRAVLLVAREDEGGPAVGVLVASRMLSVKFAGRSLWIEELYVGRHARRKGYGRDMVEGLLDRATAQGIQGIDLESYHGNDAAALLYRSLGFRRLGRERFSYDLEWEKSLPQETPPQ